MDYWDSPDKVAHFTGTAAIATVVAAATQSERIGFATGVIIASAKEFYDYKHPESHQASFRDLAWSVAGAYAGAKFGGWVFYRQPDGYRFSWSIRF